MTQADHASRPSNAVRPDQERGAVLVVAIILMLVLGMMSFLLVETSADVTEQVQRRAEEVRLDAIGEAAIDLAMHGLWLDYKGSLDGADNSAVNFRAYLDARGINARAPVDGTEEEFDIFGQVTHDEPQWTDVLSTSGLPRNAAGEHHLDGAQVHAIRVLREDTPWATAFRVHVTLSFGSAEQARYERDIERIYTAGGEFFRGFEFALLANNVNCIMCHATIDSAARYYNTDPALYGTFDRVRAGTLQSLKIRRGSADSMIAGALYTRGPVMDKQGSLLTTLNGSGLDSVAFDLAGNILQDADGDMTLTDFVNTTGDPLPAGGNLYLDYPRDQEKQSDGPFPEEFPPVVPDENGNRIVDGDEFDAETGDADGTLTGGNKIIVPIGSSYAGTSLPTWDSAPTLSGGVTGNVILVGTAASPLVIDGRIAIEGDVVIAGVVKGEGEIIARNNTYVVGPLTYADGTTATGARTFGYAADGSENRLMLAAGGNVLVGDYLTEKGGGAPITGDDTAGFNFTMSEVTLFNQMEWAYTQPEIADDSGVLVPNPVYDPDHVPRYYVVDPANPVYIFNKEDTYFDVETKTWLGKEHLGGWSTDKLTILPVGDPVRDAAAVVALNPWGGWLSPTQLVTMWEDTEAAHAGGPFPVDAFLYTNNSIMLLTRKSTDYNGQVVLNGGLVGADLGILVAGGLQLNFDGRHTDVLKLQESRKGEISLMRGARLR